MSITQPIPCKVKTYSSKDKNAPQLTGHGDFLTILKACLITGYGDKEGAGWRALYSDEENKIITFERPTASTPYVLKIDESSTQNGTKYFVQIEPESVKSEDGVYSTSNYTNYYRYNYDYNVKEWRLFATERAFLFHADLTDNRKCFSLYFGDLQSEIKRNVALFNLNFSGYYTSSILDNEHTVRYNEFPARNGLSTVSEEPLQLFYLPLLLTCKLYDAGYHSLFKTPFLRVFYPLFTVSENSALESEKNALLIKNQHITYNGQQCIILSESGNNMIAVPLDYWEF